MPAKQPKPGVWQVIVPAEGGHVWRFNTQTGVLEACTITVGDTPKAQCLPAHRPDDPLGIRYFYNPATKSLQTTPLKPGETAVGTSADGSPVKITRVK